MPSSPEEVLSYVCARLDGRGASREALLRQAYQNNAPHGVIMALYRVPSAFIWDEDHLRQALACDRGVA